MKRNRDEEEGGMEQEWICILEKLGDLRTFFETQNDGISQERPLNIHNT